MRISESKMKRQQHKIVKHTHTIRRLLPKNYLSVFDHFWGLALKGLLNSCLPKVELSTKGIIYIVRSKNFPKNCYSLLPISGTSKGLKKMASLSGSSTYPKLGQKSVINGNKG